MTIGLTTFAIASAAWSGPLIAQFGGAKSYWVDLIMVAVLMGGAVFAVCRSSRRY